VIADLLIDPAAQLVIGHRGASGLAPENTLPAFDLAIEQGAEALEFDVRLSADGVPVVHHDPTLTRTAGWPDEIAALPLARLRDADAGATFCPHPGEFPYRGTGVRVPTLREVLDRYRALPLLIEIKLASASVAVLDEIRRSGAEGRVVVASFDYRALDPLRRGNILVGAARRDIVRHFAAGFVGGPRRPPAAVCFAVPHRYKGRIEVPTPRFIAGAHRFGRPVHVWTVDDPATAAGLWRRGVNGILTNYPGRLRPLRPGPSP